MSDDMQDRLRRYNESVGIRGLSPEEMREAELPDPQPVGGGDAMLERLRNYAQADTDHGFRERAEAGAWSIAEITRLRSEVERLRAQAKQHRWIIEPDGSDLLVCDGNHDKVEPCDMVRYSPATVAEAAEHALEELKAEAVEVVGPMARLHEQITRDHGPEWFPVEGGPMRASLSYPVTTSPITWADFRRAAQFLSKLQHPEGGKGGER